MLTLMDFYADWCGPCQAMHPIFEKVMPEYKGKVVLEKINVDENQSKAQKFGVMSIPTMVLVKDGEEISRKVGLLHEAMLKEWLGNNL